MKRSMILLLLTIGASTAASAASTVPESALAPGHEPVDSFRFYGRLDDFYPIDRDTLIVWATPAEPYLVELSRRSTHLPYAETIGVTSTQNTVHAKLDSVRVRGLDYPIRAIYKLSRHEARELRLA